MAEGPGRSAALPEAAAGELSTLLGRRYSAGSSVREQHSHGESYHAPRLPDGVAFPVSTEEVSAIARVCTRHRVPMTPFGAGSSLEGHVIAVAGGISIDLARMNRVAPASARRISTATVEAGRDAPAADHAHLATPG